MGLPLSTGAKPGTLLLWFPVLGALVYSSFSLSAKDCPPPILRFVEGVDAAPQPMKVDEIANLNDPWASFVLRKGIFPTSVEEALAALDKLNDSNGGLPEQASFFVSESGHIPVDAASKALKREFRMVVTRGGTNDSLPGVLCSAPAGQREGFIELMSWDPTKKAFNFYRRTKKAEWVWKGDTRDAFRRASGGKGCFQCHVSGVPVMKELHRPWNNWHSQVASIPRDAIPSQEIRDSPLFKNRSNAEDLEPVVRGWVSEATAARIADLMKGDTLADAPNVVRPLFETTTVNLASSNETSDRDSPTLDLPVRFFIDSDTLSNVLGLNLPPSFRPVVKRQFYNETLATFASRLEDGTFSRKGDTHFAFFAPEPSLEGIETIRQLIAQKVITRHFAASVLLVDFPNPVYSSARSRLLCYVPAIGHVQDGRSDVAERTALAILQAAATQPAGSPEKQFAANWALSPDQLRADAESRLKNYLAAVQKRLKTQAGLDAYTRLAESRRRRFGQSPLHEFPLLLPKTNIPVTELRMNADGTVSP